MKKVICIIISLVILLIVCVSYVQADGNVCVPAGDTNSDGSINLSDVSLLLMYIAKWDGLTINPEQADTLNDDKINLTDVSILLKYIARWQGIRLGHNDTVTIVDEATCKSNGETIIKCTVCDSEETIIIPMVACRYEKSTSIAATCTKDGMESYKCTMCGDSYSNIIPATGNHKYNKTTVKKPTCSTSGQDKYTCSVCGDSYTKSVVATGKHAYKDGGCTVCGKADPAVVKKIQVYCDWLVENGELNYNEYKNCYEFVDSLELEGVYYFVFYRPSEKLLWLNMIDTRAGFTYNLWASVYITIDDPKVMTFSYQAYKDDFYYANGTQYMTASDFSNKTSLDFDVFSSDAYNSCPQSHKELAWMSCNNILIVSSVLIDDANTGFSLSDLGYYVH